VAEAAAAEVTYCLRQVTTLVWDEDVKGAFSVTFYPENQETLPRQLRKQPGILL